MTKNSPQLNGLLSPDCISCHLHSSHRDDALNELISLLRRQRPELTPELVLQAVIDRETVFPTVIAPGLAVPHARLPELQKPLIAIGLAPAGIDFGGGGGEPVRVIIMILTPRDDPGMHLQLLAALGKIFCEPGAVEAFAALTTPEEVIAKLTGDDAKVPDYLRARDLMDTRVITLDEADTLLQAIHTFAVTGVSEIPVIDHEGDLRGLISTADLLRLSLPEHLLWLQDLSPIYRFQPFSEMLRTAGETKLTDVMREDFLKVSEEVPAVQLAKLFLMNKVEQIIVLDAAGRLAGVVHQHDFAAKLFWE